MARPIFVVPENPPDEGDFWFIGFSVDWLPVLLAAIQLLRDPDLWVDGDTLDVVGQIDTLIDLMMENLD